MGAGGEGLAAVLAAHVYDFLVVKGYHAHYPSAEAQAEKFAPTLAAAVAEWLTQRLRSEDVREAAGDAVGNRDQCIHEATAAPGTVWVCNVCDAQAALDAVTAALTGEGK